MSQDDVIQKMEDNEEIGLIVTGVGGPQRITSEFKLSYAIQAAKRDDEDDDFDDNDDFDNDDDFYGDEDEEEDNPFEREPDEEELLDDDIPLEDPEDDLTDDDDEIPYN